MNLTTIQHPLSTIVDQFDPPQNRKPGWHVTDLYKAAQAIAKGEEVPNGGWPFEGDTSGLMAWGRMWEAACRNWITNKAEEMGLLLLPPDPEKPTIEVSEIIGNLDGELIYPNLLNLQRVAVCEMKATTTADHRPTSKPSWMVQAKAYCHMVGVNQVWFLVLNMPRKGAPSASVYQHIIDFEDWELQENWNMLISTKEYLESRGIKLWQD